MPRIYFFTNSVPLYYCYKCPKCGKYNVGQTSLKSSMPTFIGRSNAVKANMKKLSKHAEAIISNEEVFLPDRCYSCGCMPKWSRKNLTLFSVVLRALAVTSLVLALGFFCMMTDGVSSGMALAATVCGAVTLLTSIGCMCIDRFVRSQYKKLSKEDMPMADIDGKRLYLRIQKTLPVEVVENINSLKYTLLGHFYES